MTIPTFYNHVGGTFSQGFYLGGASLTTVPYKMDVAVNGVGYMIDEKYLAEYTDRSVKLLRTQADNSGEVGEASVNPEAYAPRSRSTWHQGAGQARVDRFDSQRARYRASKGINVWTDDQISLLNDTDQKVSSASTNFRLAIAGARIYFLDNTAVKYTDDITADTPSLTTVSSSGSNAKLSIASDGYTVWFTDGSDVYTTNTGTSAASVFSTTDIDLLGWCKNRLLGAEDGELFSCTDLGAGTFTSLFTHNEGANFTWVGFAEGQSAIYAAGFAGDKSVIYRIAVKPDASGLDLPVVAGTLPDGEIIRGIGGYLGFILLGTDKGWRFCIPDAQGNLRIGANVATPAAVRCFEGQDRFVWFGSTNYDSTSSGLGRMDLSLLGDEDKQQPAYASDLMVTAQAAVLDVATFQSLRVFAISGLGIYAETTSQLVASGTLQTGYFDFGLADEKVAIEATMAFGASFAGSLAIAIATNESSTYTTLGTVTTANSTQAMFPAAEKRGAKFELQFTLTRDASAVTTGPKLTGWTLRAQPAPTRVILHTVPLKLFEKVKDLNHVDVYQKPLDLRRGLESLVASQEITTYQVADEAISVTIEDFEWRPHARCADDKTQGWNGTWLGVLKQYGN